MRLPLPPARRLPVHAAGALLAVLGGALLLTLGELDRDPQRGHRAPYLYMITVFPFFGAVCAELLFRRAPAARRLGGELAALATLALLRLFAGIPASGHVMMQTWFVLRVRALVPHRGLAVVELALGLVALCAYTGVKLFAWHDAVSPGLGALLGAAIAAVGARVAAPPQ